MAVTGTGVGPKNLIYVADYLRAARAQFVPSGPVNDKVLAALPDVTSVEHRGTRIVVAGSGDLTTRVLYALVDQGVQV